MKDPLQEEMAFIDLLLAWEEELSFKLELWSSLLFLLFLTLQALHGEQLLGQEDFINMPESVPAQIDFGNFGVFTTALKNQEL